MSDCCLLVFYFSWRELGICRYSRLLTVREYQRSKYVLFQRIICYIRPNPCIADYTVPAMEASLDDARLTFETNFFSVICICKTFLPLLIRAKGTIVQIGSVAGVS